MTPLEAVRVAWDALRANKLRSALTMLGVVIGVMSVVLLVAIGSGARQEVTSGVESLGSNILFVAPGNFSVGSAPAVSRLTLEDARKIGDAVGDPSRVAVTVQSGEIARVGARRMTVNSRTISHSPRVARKMDNSFRVRPRPEPVAPRCSGRP